MEIKTPGQVAFEAYRNATAFNRLALYTWDKLPGDVPLAWEAAARAVLEDDARKNKPIVNTTHFRDARGALLWIDPLVMARLHGVGDVIVHNSTCYMVMRVALAAGVQHVNVEAAE